MFLLAETRKELVLVNHQDVENEAARKSWELYDPGGCMIIRYFKRLNKHHDFF